MSDGPLLLDTCALIWLINGDPLKEEAKLAIRLAANAGGLFVSPISAWEIGSLTRKKRLVLNRDPEDWFEQASSIGGVALAALPWRVLLRSQSLPGDPPPDPADRILITTARQDSLRLVTRDRKVLAYSEQGHLAALAC